MQQSDDPWIGEELDGRWRVLALIGQGAMGHVYRAEHKLLRRSVAVKVIAERFVDEVMMQVRFLREAMAVARLQHPHIVGAIDFGAHRGRPYFVMERVDGETLEVVIAREGWMSVRRALELTLQLAHALGTAHEAGVLHRDVKPGNVLVSCTELGECAKIVDFGVASLGQGSFGLTMPGFALGTPGYLAPEQARNGMMTPAVDVYALGATLFEMLTGAPVFPAELSACDVLRAHLHDMPRAPSSSLPHIDVEIDDLIMRMLAKNPADRPRDGMAVARAVQRLLDGGAGRRQHDEGVSWPRRASYRTSP